MAIERLSRTASPDPLHAQRVVSVLVVDDDALVRRALVDVLTSTERVRVVGQADDGARAADLVEATRADIVLMDVEMPGLDGVRAAWRLSLVRPELPVVLMAADPSNELVILALRAGAAGVVPKSLDADALCRVLHGVLGGEGAISRRTCRAMSRELHRCRELARQLRPIDSPLTTREWQILHLMEAGVPTEEMARQLYVSLHTVRSHVKRILAKLGVHSRAAAVAWARTAPGVPAATPLDVAGEEQSLARELTALLHNVG